MYRNYIDKDWKNSLLFFSKKPYCKYLNNDKLKTKIDLIWDKYKNKPFIKEIIQNKRLTEDDIKQRFIISDPTNKKIYLNWILNSFERNGIKRLEDLGRINQAISKILLLNESKKLSIDILKYNGLELEDVIDLHRDFFEERERNKLEDEQIKLETEYLYEGKEIRIISPQTERSAKYYGKNTRWCTAADEDNQFENYFDSGNLYIILIKNPSPDYIDEKYQFHFEDGEFMNEKDETINLDDIIDKYSELMIILNLANLYNEDNYYILCSKFQLEEPKINEIKKIIIFNNKITDLSKYQFIVIKFGDNINNSIILPNSLKFLEMGRYFNQSIILPEKLEYLTLGYKFNQPIILPNSLKKLVTGWLFDQPLNLPQKLKSLILGEYYNLPLVFPDSLENLELSENYNQPIKVKQSTYIFFRNKNQQKLVTYID